jgi:hypothetical protein
MMVTLDQYEISVLVTIALADGQYRAMSNYETFRSIEHKGLTTVVNRVDVYNAHKLTPAGIQAVLDLPDDYKPKSGFYPIASDIQKAKAIVRGLAE